jgi:GAF domain-containing protein
MADQVQATVGGLEGQIAARTRDLQTVVDVTTRIATILNVEQLLDDVTDLTKDRFSLYHAHIYLYNREEDRFVLTAGAGYVGEQMVAEKRSIDFHHPKSIVALAGRTRQSVRVGDVTDSPDFLPHPLLPNTRSELAIPLIARGELLGVLDVQSDKILYFESDIQTTLEVLATQVSTALSNARLFASAERTSRHEHALGTITRSIEGATSVDDVLQTAVRELGKALRVPHTAIELQLTNTTLEDET